MMCPTIETPQVSRGLRRITPDMRRSDQIADAFDGLPEGVSRWRLAAAIRGAARKLGLNPSMLALVEHYIDVTYDVDWMEGSEPIITRPLVEIAEHMAKSERQIRNIEQMLAARGLLIWRDSGNHHRKGRRDRDTGRLRYAYGPSLAPLATRATEIIELSSEARRELAEIRQLRIAISALRRRFRAEEIDANCDDACRARALKTFQSLPVRNPVKTSIDDLRSQIDRLKEILSDLQNPGVSDQEYLVDEPKTSGKAEKTSLHITDTTKENSINGSCRPIATRPHMPRKTRSNHRLGTPMTIQHTAVLAGLDRITLNMAIKSAGQRIGFYIEANKGNFGWRELVNSAIAILPEIRLDHSIWRHACAVLGRNGAAIAVLLIERGIERTFDSRHSPITNPPAYLSAMLNRARSGKLDLHRSMMALMKAAEA